MNYDLTIDFAGLCTFVMNGAPERLQVLFVRDKSGQAKHAPRLTFDVLDRQSFEGDGISQVVPLPDGRQFASWDLTGKILELSLGDGSPSAIKICGPEAPQDVKPRDPLEELNFSWVPSLGGMGGVGNGKGAVVAAHYLTDDPGAKGAVAARFDTQRGFLFSDPRVNRMYVEDVLSFAPGKQQYLSEAVRLEVRGIQAQSICFKAKKFGGAAAGSLCLESKHGSPIAVTLSNLPTEFPAEHEQHGAHHFNLYYDLFEPAPAPSERPVPKPPGDHHGMPQGIFPARCTPSQTP
jgi:hypothetical protein